MNTAYQPCPDCLIETTNRHVHLDLTGDWNVLSSAVLGGGLVRAKHLLNLYVDGSRADEAPEHTLARYSRERGWNGGVVGMMTAASMDSLAVEHLEHDGVHVLAAVTSGLSNAKRIGEQAEWPHFACVAPEAHTINILVLTTAELTGAALAESLIMITEAKVAVLQDLQVPSTTGAWLATGTGTDAVAVCSRVGGIPVRYVGKHVLMGELLGGLVIRALTRSLHWYGKEDGCAAC